MAERISVPTPASARPPTDTWPRSASALNLATLRRGALYVLLFALACICLYPFYLMIIGSFKSNAELFSMRQTLLPERFHLANYVNLFDRFPFDRILFNTVFFASSRVVLGVFFSTIAGFAYAKYDFPGRQVSFLLLLATMMVPFQAIVVPSYLLIREFGWLNTYTGLIIPGAIPAFGVFLMRQYFIGAVPDEILEAARIDGCSEFKMFWSVGLPMARAGATVLGILLFMNTWNAFLWPFVIINREELYLVTVVVQAINAGGIYTDYGMALAAITLGSLPLLIAFVFVQKHFISSLMTGFGK
jgi:cellobiose transport system permease protein